MLTVLLWIYVIGVILTAAIFTWSFNECERRHNEMDSNIADKWAKIEVVRDQYGLRNSGLAIVMGLIWPYYLLPSKSKS